MSITRKQRRELSGLRESYDGFMGLLERIAERLMFNPATGKLNISDDFTDKIELTNSSYNKLIEKFNKGKEKNERLAFNVIRNEIENFIVKLEKEKYLDAVTKISYEKYNLLFHDVNNKKADVMNCHASGLKPSEAALYIKNK